MQKKRTSIICNRSFVHNPYTSPISILDIGLVVFILYLL
jgi:hypothetical protein